MTGSRWSENEWRKLDELTSTGATWKEIGTQIGRSAEACRKQYAHLAEIKGIISEIVDGAKLRLEEAFNEWALPQFKASIELMQNVDHNSTYEQRREAVQTMMDYLDGSHESKLFKKFIEHNRQQIDRTKTP